MRADYSMIAKINMETVMRLCILAMILLSTSAFGQFCADPFEGKWQCDTDIFGYSIEIKVLPPGHGLSNGFISIINSKLGVTAISAPLTAAWTDGSEYFPVKASCTPRDTVEIAFKDREIEYRKSTGTITLGFEEFDGAQEFHIIVNVKFKDGSNYTLNATCKKR